MDGQTTTPTSRTRRRTPSVSSTPDDRRHRRLEPPGAPAQLAAPDRQRVQLLGERPRRRPPAEGRRQWGRLYYGTDYSVRGDHHLLFNFGVPTTVRLFNTPTFSKNEATVTGLFFQDTWTMNRLTLNVGGRYDRYVGRLPAQESPGGPFAEPRVVEAREVIDQSIGVWRAGASRPHRGTTALKASYSRSPSRSASTASPTSTAHHRHQRLPVERPQRRPPLQLNEINAPSARPSPAAR